MPITRVELIARGFAHADKNYPGGVPLNSLLSSHQLGSLTPEEKVSVVHRFDELTSSNKGSGPTLRSSIGEGVAKGIMSAAPMAILGGALTVPSLSALKAAKAIGGVAPWIAIGKKFAAPIALTAGVGAFVGGTYGVLKHLQDASSNKYLSKALEEIRREPDPEEKKIKTMALFASSPLIAHRVEDTRHYRDAGISMGTGAMVNRGAYSELLPGNTDVPVFHEAEGEHPLGGPKIVKVDSTDIPYDDWRYVRGIGSIDPTVGIHGPLGRKYVDQERFNMLSEDTKKDILKLSPKARERLFRGMS